MRKSSLVLLLAMAFVLTTVVSGFCVVNEVGEPCKICTDKTNGWKYGLEIEMIDCDPTVQGAECPCPTFDYELGSLYDGSCSSGGYCDIQDVKGILFKLCDCEKIADMDPLKMYALRLSIMAPAAGVYWTNVNPARGDQNCDFTPVRCAEATSTGSVYVSSHADPSLSGNSYCVDPCDAATTSRFSMKYYSVTEGQSLYNPCTQTDNCCFTCGTNRVTAVQTCYGRILSNAKPLLLVDIPTLVYDPNDINVQLGAAVTVKVELVEMPDGGDICVGSCKSMCECLVKIGEFSNCSPQGCSLCLPYMPGINSGWWTGIAVTNNNKAAVDVKFGFYAAGTSASYTFKVPAHSVDSFTLGSIVDDLAGLDLDAPIYASAVGSDGINAFVMMGDGAQAQGYVAAAGDCGCGGCK